VAASGIRRLVLGVRDPNPHVVGGGLSLIRAAGVAATLGVAGEECLDLIWPFVVTGAFARPFVLLKTATSLDGRFAPPPGPGTPAPVYLTGAEARRDVHRLRRWADLLLVGAGTIRADQPTLDGRLAGDQDRCPAADPMPGYVDADLGVLAPWRRRGHLAFGGRESARPESVRAVEERGGTAVLCEEHDGQVVPASLLDRLAGVGVHALMIEGGPRLALAFLAGGLVDRWVSFVAPAFLGAGPGWPPVDRGGGEADPPATGRFHLTRCDRVGDDARLVYDRVCFGEVRRQLTAAPEA
jgi:diaminohydroxyphosphoribosylaminopyrimidine deaminase/5-amino-6-(5-phosphoribosylamino)uracil reductase